MSDDQSVNSGTLAHRALKRWIQVNGYQDPDPCRALAEAAAACLAELAGGPPPGWTVARARLLARGSSLAELIGSRGADEVVPETEFQDHDLRLRGTPDLVLLGGEIVVLDLKTQTLKDGELPAWVQFQLTIYAHLVKKAYGSLPRRAAVYSLNRGRIAVPVTEDTLIAALELVRRARAADSAFANPSPDTCYYCVRRLECQPHWDAASDWLDADCVEGWIERVEHAATGVAALLIQTTGGSEWVSGVPAHLVTGGVGTGVRMVRLRRVAATEGGVGGWRWRNSSALSVS